MYLELAKFIPLGIFLFSILVLLSFIKYRDWKIRKKARKNPLTSDLLRGPGEGLRNKVDELSDSINAYVVMLYMLPIITYSMYLTQLVLAKIPSKTSWILLAVTLFILFCWFLWKLHTLLNQRVKYVLGLDAEIATGQELNQLMRERFWVFHDFPAEGFNIDHVVIGATGVFAIETKGRTKSTLDDSPANREVFSDGVTLQFPGWIETKPIKQAEIQAKWLQEWLTGAIGEAVLVYPVVALPGWYVKLRKKGGVPVINGKNCGSFFTKFNNERPLPEKIQAQIVHNVESRCRNVLPKAYREANEQA